MNNTGGVDCCGDFPVVRVDVPFLPAVDVWQNHRFATADFGLADRPLDAGKSAQQKGFQEILLNASNPGLSGAGDNAVHVHFIIGHILELLRGDTNNISPRQRAAA